MKKYNIIYADPAWSYRDKASAGDRGASFKYQVMNVDDIKDLPVSQICEDNCILFLWVTFPMLQEGLDVIKAWGFKYKTVGFVWVKLNRIAKTLFWGMGNWSRSNAEICLLAVRGNPKRIHKGIHSVIMSVVERHSKKPDEARDRIIKLVGDLPRVELFARDKVDGWDVWGNEIESDIELTDVD